MQTLWIILPTKNKHTHTPEPIHVCSGCFTSGSRINSGHVTHTHTHTLSRKRSVQARNSVRQYPPPKKHSTWKRMLRRRSFLFGAWLSGRCENICFRECNLSFIGSVWDLWLSFCSFWKTSTLNQPAEKWDLGPGLNQKLQTTTLFFTFVLGLTLPNHFCFKQVFRMVGFVLLLFLLVVRRRWLFQKKLRYWKQHRWSTDLETASLDHAGSRPFHGTMFWMFGDLPEDDMLFLASNTVPSNIEWDLT